MKQIIYALEDDYGMHARPASRLAEVSQNYRSSMEIKYKEKTVTFTVENLADTDLAKMIKVNILRSGTDCYHAAS